MDETTIVGGSARAAAMQGGWQGGWNGVSWSAVIAGAFTALAVSFIVIALGTGIGMTVASPYSSSPSVGTMTIIGALWLVFAQAVGSQSAVTLPAGCGARRQRYIPTK